MSKAEQWTWLALTGAVGLACGLAVLLGEPHWWLALVPLALGAVVWAVLAMVDRVQTRREEPE